VVTYAEVPTMAEELEYDLVGKARLIVQTEVLTRDVQRLANENSQ